MDKIQDIYIKSVINGEKLSNGDMQEIMKIMLNHIADDDFRYDIYVKQIKTEAFRVLEAFKDWYNDKNTVISVANYMKFYSSISNTFQYDVYRSIYLFFNPIVFKNNFINDSTLSDNLSECMLMNDEFIVDVFAEYLYWNTLTKDQYICNSIDWHKEYIEPGYSVVNDIQLWKCNPDYARQVNREDLMTQELMKRDPRWLFN